MVQEAEMEDANSTETLDDIATLSEIGAQQVQQMVAANPVNVGERNDGVRKKYKGTGKKPLGNGPGVGGFGREQRWFVRFADGSNIDEYARQLDFFKVELGAYVPGGKLTYLTNASQAQPTTRAAEVGADEQRLYMTWKSAGRREADVQIFRKAGIDATNAVIMHFYPPETEQQMAKAETDYRGRAVADILRTYFVVRSNGADGYLFVVTAQTYIR